MHKKDNKKDGRVVVDAKLMKQDGLFRIWKCRIFFKRDE